MCGLFAGAAAAPPPLRLDAAVTGRLLATRVDLSEAIAVGDAPAWTVSAMDVFAPDARTEQIGQSDRRRIARSTHRLFRIGAAGGEWLGVLVLDARGTFVAATVFGGSSIYRGENVSGNTAPEIEFRDLADFLPEGVQLASSCDFKQSMSPAVLPSLAPPGASARASNDAPAGALVQARLAIDTDNEFMSLKFTNNTTAASNYIAQLIALVTVVYERDLGVRLTIGSTVLRTAPDPYATDGTSTPAQLNEFGEFWRVNQAGVARAFAIQLSGKSGAANSASGIAWLLTSGNYCASTGKFLASTLQGTSASTRSSGSSARPRQMM